MTIRYVMKSHLDRLLPALNDTVEYLHITGEQRLLNRLTMHLLPRQWCRHRVTATRLPSRDK